MTEDADEEASSRLCGHWAAGRRKHGALDTATPSMTGTRRERLARHRMHQRRYRPTRAEFERLVWAALEELPSEFRERLENVAVVVDEWPPVDSQGSLGSKSDGMILGLYDGVSLLQRGSDYHLNVPDRITIYRGPIVALCRSQAELVREVRDTVRHEVGHYFGLSDHELP
jgi:predicted Zn-dependent protease with MMP-like domain